MGVERTQRGHAATADSDPNRTLAASISGQRVVKGLGHPLTDRC